MRNGCIPLLNKSWLRQNEAIFLLRLGRLLKEGYALDQALRFLIIQYPDDIQATLEKEFLGRLQNGEPLYQILSSCGFHPTSISFCYFGENNGQLATMVETAGGILQNHYTIKRKLIRLLAYPLFLLFFTVLMLTLFQIIILPQFQSFFISFSLTPRGLLSFLFWLHEHPSVILYFLLIVCFSLLFIYRYLWYPRSSYQKQILLVRIPILGKFFQLWNTYYFTFHLSQLLKSGLSLADSLTLLARDPEKTDLKQAVAIIKHQLLSGRDFPSALSMIPLWRKELKGIIHHGQVSGTLERELLHYSRFCFDLMTETIEKYIRILQPAILSFIGFLIIFLYFSILLPTFQLLQNI